MSFLSEVARHKFDDVTVSRKDFDSKMDDIFIFIINNENVAVTEDNVNLVLDRLLDYEDYMSNVHVVGTGFEDNEMEFGKSCYKELSNVRDMIERCEPVYRKAKEKSDKEFDEFMNKMRALNDETSSNNGNSLSDEIPVIDVDVAVSHSSTNLSDEIPEIGGGTFNIKEPEHSSTLSSLDELPELTETTVNKNESKVSETDVPLELDKYNAGLYFFAYEDNTGNPNQIKIYSISGDGKSFSVTDDVANEIHRIDKDAKIKCGTFCIDPSADIVDNVLTHVSHYTCYDIDRLHDILADYDDSKSAEFAEIMARQTSNESKYARSFYLKNLSYNGEYLGAVLSEMDAFHDIAKELASISNSKNTEASEVPKVTEATLTSEIPKVTEVQEAQKVTEVPKVTVTPEAKNVAQSAPLDISDLPTDFNDKLSWYAGNARLKYFAKYFKFEKDGMYWNMVDPRGVKWTLVGDLIVPVTAFNSTRIDNNTFNGMAAIYPDGSLHMNSGRFLPSDYMRSFIENAGGIGNCSDHTEENMPTIMYRQMVNMFNGFKSFTHMNATDILVNFVDIKKRCVFSPKENNRPYMFWKGVLAGDDERDQHDISYIFKPSFNPATYTFDYLNRIIFNKNEDIIQMQKVEAMNARVGQAQDMAKSAVNAVKGLFGRFKKQ